MKNALLAAVDDIPRTAEEIATLLHINAAAAAQLCRSYTRRGDVRVFGVLHRDSAGQPPKLYVAISR